MGTIGTGWRLPYEVRLQEGAMIFGFQHFQTKSAAHTAFCSEGKGKGKGLPQQAEVA